MRDQIVLQLLRRTRPYNRSRINHIEETLGQVLVASLSLRSPFPTDRNITADVHVRQAKKTGICQEFR